MRIKVNKTQKGAIFVLIGHLKIFEIDLLGIKDLIFDRHNLIVNEGRGVVMDFLAKEGYSESYTINAFTSIVLTKNTATENATDTFLNAVFNGTDYISDDGVLHIAGGDVAVTHSEGTSTIDLSGTIQQANGNDPANNHINSVCVCMGTSNSGGAGQASYSASGNERLFSRVHVGDLVKTVDKSYTFEWSFTVS